MSIKFDNIFGILVVLIPVAILLYVTIRNSTIDNELGKLNGKLGDVMGSKITKENFAGNVRNRNFQNPNWKNGVFYQRKDKQMLPTNPIMAPTFNANSFDEQVSGFNIEGMSNIEDSMTVNDGVDEKGMQQAVAETSLSKPNWLGGIFYQKRDELGKFMGLGQGEKRDSELDDTNDLREGFLDVGFGEALRDGINTLIGRSSDRDLPSVNPNLAYVKTQPDIPFHDPRVGSVRDAPTAAVKIPVLVDDKSAVSQQLYNKTKSKTGKTMTELSADMLANKMHSNAIKDIAKDLTDIGMDFVQKKNRRELGFGNLSKRKSGHMDLQRNVVQQLYSVDKTDGGLGTVQSGKREFSDDADIVRPLVSGKVDCLAYPIMRDGKIKQINIANNGNDYKKAPKVKVVGKCKREAKLKAVIDGGGAVVYVDIDDEGEGYETTPKIKFLS